MRIPFAYIIKSKTHIYVGSKYSADAHPSQLLTSYFTSSKYAKPMILQDLENWTIERLYEASSTEDALAKEMEWQLEFKNQQGLLNKCINRAEGKWVNFGPKTDETKRKISESRKGYRNPPEVAKAIGLKNKGKIRSKSTKDLCRQLALNRWKNRDEETRSKIGETISKTMKLRGTSSGVKNSNITRWVLKSPSGEIICQPSDKTGRQFISDLGLSYQMIVKCRSKNLPFTGKQFGWEVVSSSRPLGQKQNLSGIRRSTH